MEYREKTEGSCWHGEIRQVMAVSGWEMNHPVPGHLNQIPDGRDLGPENESPQPIIRFPVSPRVPTTRHPKLLSP